MIDTASFANLIAYSAQVALITVAGALAMWLLRIDVPAIRYTYWRVLLAACLVLPLVQPWTPRLLESVGSAVTIEGSGGPIVGSAASTGASTSNASASDPRLPRLSPALVAWVIGVGAIGRLAWLAIGLLRLRRLRRSGSPASDPDIDELSRWIRVRADVRYVAGRGQPATFGFRRPVVLLPDFLRSLSPAIQRAIVAHELWHVRRRDWLWVVVEETVCAALWFHPAIWWLVVRVRNAREEVVDELTILITGARRPYLEALLTFADEPPIFAAAALARRRHLFHRIVLISKEAVMSSKRLVASCAAMAAIVVCSGWFAVQAFPLIGPAVAATAQQPPPPPPPAPPRDSGAMMVFVPQSEDGLRKAIAANPRIAGPQIALARQQEERGDLAAAEATLMTLRQNVPNDKTVLHTIAAFYVRTGQFDRAVATVEDIVQLDPSDPERHHMLATFYWDKAFRDHTLPASTRQQYIEAGIAAADRAMVLNPDYVEPIIYKNLFLRMQAEVASDAASRQRLIREADALRARAMEMNRARPRQPAAGREYAGAAPPPPPPPPPPMTGNMPDTLNTAPVRVGGAISTPRKIRDVHPVYPPIARSANVQGVVLVETTIDEFGNVARAQIVRSIPLLDQAALDAVKQWMFEPTRLNGRAVPVVMTQTVHFSIQ